MVAGRHEPTETSNRCMQCFNLLRFCICYEPKLSEPVESGLLEPPGSRAILHDTNTSWHGDELHIKGVE